jgi:hypothetical protein
MHQILVTVLLLGAEAVYSNMSLQVTVDVRYLFLKLEFHYVKN